MSRFLFGLAAFFFTLPQLMALESEPFRCRSPRWYSITEAQEKSNERTLNDYMEKKLKEALEKAQPYIGRLKCKNARKLRGSLEDLLVTSKWTRTKGMVERFVESEEAQNIKRCSIKFECSTHFYSSYFEKNLYHLHVKMNSRNSKKTDEDKKTYKEHMDQWNRVCKPGSKERMPLSKEGKVRADYFQPVIKMCKSYIGTDKFSHFIDQGHEYLKIYSEYGEERVKGVKAAMNYGMGDEEGERGWSSSHMKSYSDLAANLSGLKFWLDMRPSQNKDNSFYYCDDQGYVQRNTKKHFNWCDYMGPSMDEAINCFVPGSGRDFSHFNKRVRHYIKKYSSRDEDNMNYTCPMSEAQYEEAAKTLKSYLKSFGFNGREQVESLDMVLHSGPFMRNTLHQYVDPKAKGGAK